MKIFFHVIVFLFLFPNWINAEAPRDVKKFNGNAWRELSRTSKSFFIGGFMSGSGYVIESNISPLYGPYDKEKGSNISSRLFKLNDNEMQKNLFSGDDLFLYFNYYQEIRNTNLLKFNIVNITNEQISDGLDRLYEDFKNRGIKLADAIYVVQKQIKGATEEEIEAILQYLRAEKDYKKMKYTNKGGETLWIDFP